MRIPPRVPDPGRAQGKTTRPVGGPLPGPTARVAHAPSGLAGVPPAPPAGTTASLLLLAMKAQLGAASGEGLQAQRAGLEARQEQKQAQKQEQMEEARARQAAGRETAWTNVAFAIASAGVTAATAVIGGAKAVGNALADLTAGQRKALVDTIGAVRQGATEAAGKAFEGVASQAPPKDINGLIQHVLRESYLDTAQDLRFYADKVKHFNDAKSSLREQLDSLRSQPRSDRKAIESLEQKLQSAGDDAQLASIDLQSKLQQQQQTLQMMSNVSKMLHDTAMALIRKIG